MSNKRRKNLPHGYCRQIADIVGTSRHYVSQVLLDPDNNNGKVASLIKKTAKDVDSHNRKIKAALRNSLTQNVML